VIAGKCNGGVSQYEPYSKKRIDCTQTKSTDEGANITQCPKIRADDKDIEDRNNPIASYSPDRCNALY